MVYNGISYVSAESIHASYNINTNQRNIARGFEGRDELLEVSVLMKKLFNLLLFAVFIPVRAYAGLPSFETWKDNCWLYMDFKTLTSTYAFDASSTGVYGDLIGGVAEVDGEYGKAYNFDGSNDRIDFHPVSHVYPKKNFTIAFYLKLREAGENNIADRSVCEIHVSPGDFIIRVKFNQKGLNASFARRYGFGYTKGAGGEYTKTTDTQFINYSSGAANVRLSTVVYNDTYAFVAATFVEDASGNIQTNVFVNGIRDENPTAAGTVGSIRTNNTGNVFLSGGEALSDGSDSVIDWWGIWNREFTEGELREIYLSLVGGEYYEDYE